MKFFKLSLIVLVVCAFAGCSLLAPDSPTNTFKAYVQASQKKDVEGIKKTLSSGTLKMLETDAKMDNSTLDESLKKDNSGAFYKEMPEMRNEKISGDTALLEVKNNKTGGWETIPFVREEGKWKIAFDKYSEEMLKKIADELIKPFSTESNSNSSNETIKP